MTDPVKNRYAVGIENSVRAFLHFYCNISRDYVYNQVNAVKKQTRANKFELYIFKEMYRQ